MSVADQIAGQLYAMQRKLDELAGQIARLERENNRLTRELAKARYIVSQSGLTWSRKRELVEQMGGK